MIRTAFTVLALMIAAAPGMAQTSSDTGAGAGTAGMEPAAPQPSPPASTTLPGVNDPMTTGSTTGAAGTADAPVPERCEMPGASSDTNPTGNTASTAEANPACR